MLFDFRLLQRARNHRDLQGFTTQTVHEAATLDFPLPVTLSPDALERFQDIKTLRSPAFQSVTLPHHSTLTQYGAHIDPHNSLISDLSLYYRDEIADHRALHATRPFRPCLTHPGDVISAVAKGGYNYYHFLIDELPKLAAWPDRSTAALYIHAAAPFQKDALELLGIQNIIDATKVKALRVQGNTYATTPTSCPGLASPWVTQWLRDQFLPLAQAPAHPTPKIFLNRRNTSSRNITNNDEILAWAQSQGFVEIQAEKLTFAQQVGLFAQAQDIIAPHGAGLTNLIFAPSSARVIELLSDVAYRDPTIHNEVCYWHIANLRGQRYGALECPSAPARSANQYHLKVPLSWLDKLYQAIQGA